MNERPSAVTFWQAVGTRFLPFADAASTELPLGRLLRLALFQVSVGLAAVLLNGTLNRVLIVELDTPTWINLVAVKSVSRLPMVKAASIMPTSSMT